MTCPSAEITGAPRAHWCPGLPRGAPRGNPGHQWARGAPVISADGQVILYGSGISFDEGEFFVLQKATNVQTAPLWATPVGHAYRLAASNPTKLANTSISFSYLG